MSAVPIEFDFINTRWDDWELLYYTLKPVPGWTWPETLVYLLTLRSPTDGLSTALSSFSLRALASGHAERKTGKWRISVEKVGIFAHDVFNFADSGSTLGDALGCWNCARKRFVALRPPLGPDPLNSTTTCLSNAVFRDFRDRYGFGDEFLVLSVPRVIELHKDNEYVYPL